MCDLSRCATCLLVLPNLANFYSCLIVPTFFNAFAYTQVVDDKKQVILLFKVEVSHSACYIIDI